MNVDRVMQALEDLEPKNRTVLLLRLVFYLAQAARDAYIEAGNGAEESAQRLKGCNEMQIVLISELISADNAKESRSPKDLAESLQHWARVGNCAQELDWACQKAVEPRV